MVDGCPPPNDMLTTNATKVSPEFIDRIKSRNDQDCVPEFSASNTFTAQR
jgi:hypothetical protein